jgi:hypothetical protein
MLSTSTRQFWDRVARVQKRVLWSRLFCVNCWAKSPLAKQLGPSSLLFRSFHRSLTVQLPFESGVSIVKNWSCPLPQCLTTHWARSVVEEHCLPNRFEHLKTNEKLRWELCWFIYKCLLIHICAGAKNYEQGQMPLKRHLPRSGNKERVHLNQRRNQGEHIRSS